MGIYTLKTICVYQKIQIYLKPLYWWPRMKKEITEYVEKCLSHYGLCIGIIVNTEKERCNLGSWERFLPLAKFSYNNNYQLSIKMKPYEDLYGCNF
ncbi:Retrotransposable element Tf2 [Gossypium australe]|uniref:Retrotransposable element Tf2 n=1 Tax=Gossypium australe TaxID=47621 RepID=A0A5B6WJD7_9ROSI|nr:Retrotransposable element Tf2 [Gossypium australe]